MPKVAVIGSLTAGACNSPPTVITQGSPDVFVEGVSIGIVGSPIVPHKRYNSKKPHGGSVSSGSPNVFANGIPIARVNDPISCGDKIAKGASTVSAN